MESAQHILQISARIESILQCTSYVYAGASLREGIREFCAVVSILDGIHAVDNQSAPGIRAYCRRTCELSREIIFSGNDSYLPENLKLAVGDSYRTATTVLSRFVSHPIFAEDTAMRDYYTNVAKRAGDTDPWRALNREYEMLVNAAAASA